MTQASMGIWVDVAPTAEGDFNEWYNRQHVPERVGVTGFLNGARYEALKGGPKYFAYYEATGRDVFLSKEYVTRLDNPTPWTSRIMPNFRNTIRTIFIPALRLGAGRGAFLATVRFRPQEGKDAALEKHVCSELLPALYRAQTFVGMTLLKADPGASGSGVEERRLRGGEDSMAAWVIMAEGTAASELEKVCRQELAGSRLADLGAEEGAETTLYRLLYCLDKQGCV